MGFFRFETFQELAVGSSRRLNRQHRVKSTDTGADPEVFGL